MHFTKWLIVIATCGSLVFTAVKSPEQFPQVVAIALPLMTQTLQSKRDKDKQDNDNDNSFNIGS